MDFVEKIIYGLIIFFMFSHYYGKYKNTKQKESVADWPPEIDACPDYWEDIGNNRCKNILGLGKCYNKKDNNVMDFGKDYLKTKEQKCKWVKDCGISWEGIDISC